MDMNRLSKFSNQAETPSEKTERIPISTILGVIPIWLYVAMFICVVGFALSWNFPRDDRSKPIDDILNWQINDWNF